MHNFDSITKRIFKMSVMTEKQSSSEANVVLELRSPTNEESKNLPPGFNSLYYTIDVSFNPELIIEKGKSLGKTSFALPGKFPDGRLININVAHIAQGIINTIKKNHGIDVKEIRLSD